MTLGYRSRGIHLAALHDDPVISGRAVLGIAAVDIAAVNADDAAADCDSVVLSGAATGYITAINTAYACTAGRSDADAAAVQGDAVAAGCAVFDTAAIDAACRLITRKANDAAAADTDRVIPGHTARSIAAADRTVGAAADSAAADCDSVVLSGAA